MIKEIKILFVVLFISTIFMGATNNCIDGNASSTLCNPTQQFAGNLSTAAADVVKVFGIIIGWTVIAFLMFSGFRMVMSQGNEEEVQKAKTTFQWTLSGFILALFAYIIVYAVSDFIGTSDINPNGALRKIQDLNPLTSPTFGDLLEKMIINFLKVAGLVSMTLIILSGFRYITARGNEEQTDQAKRGLQWAIIGLIVILLSYVIVVATAKLFGADVTTN